MALDGVVHYDMIYLDCDDIKHELSALATSLGQSVHEKLAVTNRTENARCPPTCVCWQLVKVN